MFNFWSMIEWDVYMYRFLFITVDLKMIFVLHCISEWQFCEKKQNHCQHMIALKMYSNVIVFVVFICSYEGIKINVGVQAPLLLSLNSVEFIPYLNLCTSLSDLRIKGFELKTTQSGVSLYTLTIWTFFS